MNILQRKHLDELVFDEEKRRLENLQYQLSQCPELVSSPDLKRPLRVVELMTNYQGSFNPTENWTLAGEIIQRDNISITYINNKTWFAFKQNEGGCFGETPLIAAMLFHTGHGRFNHD